MRGKKLFSFAIIAALAFVASCGQTTDTSSAGGPRTIRVAQSGQADVTGSDNEAIQRAMDMLRPGDTIEIGPGEYVLYNSVVIPVSGVTVRGVPGETILRKAPAVASRILDGGDWGEDRFVLEQPGLFRPGMGVALIDDRVNGGYYVVVATVEEMHGDTAYLSERSIHDLNYLDGNARLESKFPLLAGYELSDVLIEGITADGNKEENPYNLDGCRGGGIYLFDCRDCTIRNCVARDYHGDGISYQITENIKVENCEAYGNTGYGVHPGTGSRYSEITDSHFHHNGVVGFFLCYRVQYGRFTNNLIEHNGRYGISVGHKDSDNYFENNTVRNNGFSGVYFRRNKTQVAGHRNVFRNNRILDNGDSGRGYGVYIEATNQGEVFTGNEIAETREGDERTQRYGIYMASGASSFTAENNRLSGHLEADIHDENEMAMK